MTKILIINGPNLNLLGQREPSIYGNKSFDDYLLELKDKFKQTELEYFQSNHCGEIIDKLQALGKDYSGVVLNAGGYSHNSIALADAVKAISVPVVEVHISNIYAREHFRKTSMLSQNCKAVLSGLGLMGYQAAVDYLLEN
ncbi:type II 3-dehydroquinate dehydratase [bacterium]|nr:type II 3-dehydroquinate dehydratase [bacterium]